VGLSDVGEAPLAEFVKTLSENREP
jgi:hypothetical protein